MNTNKNSYTIIYAIIMVVVVALVLAFVSGSLKEKQTKNVNLDKKKQILQAIKIDTKDGDAEALYKEYITEGLIVNNKGEVISNSLDDVFNVEIKKEQSKSLEERQLPIYVATVDGKQKYILSLYGAGLWGPIWGYISLDDDKNSVYGTYFSHASETPGLGAEIATETFQKHFEGKKIMNANNEFVSIAIVKPGKSANDRDYVDGISGGTITSKGVEAMLEHSIGQYNGFLQQK